MVLGPFHDTKGILNWDITSLQGLQARASWNPKTLAGLVKTGWEFCTADLCFGVNISKSLFGAEFFCRFFEKVLILAKMIPAQPFELIKLRNNAEVLACLSACQSCVTASRSYSKWVRMSFVSEKFLGVCCCRNQDMNHITVFFFCVCIGLCWMCYGRL